MRRSFVVLCVASAVVFAPPSRALTPGDNIFADGFEYRDFPADPIIDPGAPVDASTLFGGANGAPSGGPCLADPQVGTLFPNNWLRPRFTWIPGAGENLFELRLSAQNQDNALVVYTTAATWTMPANIWAALSQHTVDMPITLTVRGATYAGGSLTAGPSLGSSGAIRVAPVSASGAIVYWTNSGGGILRGFRIGDETLKDIIAPADAGAGCIGCHTATPDGTYVGLSAGEGGGPGLALLSSDGQHLTPAFISASAHTLMARQDQDAPTFSAQHWTNGDHTALTMYQSNIIWTDLEATTTAQGGGWGILARTGESTNAASASLAHTSDTVLYVSTPDPVSSGVTVTNGDIKTVPFNSRAGGTPMTVVATGDNEYYPAFSPDDHYIVYDRVPAGQSSYNNPQAEVYVSPAGGGVPVRIVANDPSSCTGAGSPGVTNSWPRWSPAASDNGGRRYYWLTFSSTRAGGQPQIYVAPVVDDGTTLITYPALYPWNQAASDASHTPDWGNFAIPF
ncbi:MAG: hypothetical protein ABIW82_01250 [Dokdonella sp.]